MRPSLACVPAVVASIAAPATAGAQDAQEAGARPEREAAAIEWSSPPRGAEAWTRACATTAAICVRAARGGRDAADVLAAAERAWDAATSVLALPPPDGGLDGAWSVYLVDERIDGGARTLPLSRDPRAHFDRASSFAVVDRATPAGCALDLAMARAVVRGSIWRAAPATDEGSATAETEHLARLLAPCAAEGTREDDATFAGAPGRTAIDASNASFARGAARFFDWLDDSYGGRSGAIVAGSWALSPTRTRAGAARWAGEPNGFDVLRRSLEDVVTPGSTLEDVFVRFAIDRVAFDPPPREAWHVPWPDRARRFASPEPVAPTGASYVVVDCAGAAAGAKLRIEAQWEDYARIRWTVLQIGASGRVIREIPVTSLDKGTRASLTLESVEGAARVVVVAVNLGSTEHPFDPNQGWWEPHGWLLTVAAE